VRKQLLLICSIAAVSLSLACGQTSPTSPATAALESTNAGPDGSTLKIGAPTLVAPANGSQIQGNPSLQFTQVTGKYTTFPVSYEIELRDGAGNRINMPITSSTTVVVGGTLAFDAVHSWKVRAVQTTAQSTAAGPWSSTFTFRTQPAAYLRTSPFVEIFDPIATGQTVGQLMGGAFLIPGVGVKMPTQASWVNYAINNNQGGTCIFVDCAGEFSLLATGVDDGSPGDKSKIMSMQEGPDIGDITDDDYRMTVELRGKNYGAPGSIACRQIFGDGVSRDCEREQEDFNDEKWYFWKFTWRTGESRLQVREGSETGRLMYDVIAGPGGGPRPYRPVPLLVHLGQPPGRNGLIDATIGGLIVKNVWVGSGPRPPFPAAPADPLPSLLSRPGGR
jgi:hypothetical protein